MADARTLIGFGVFHMGTTVAEEDVLGAFKVFLGVQARSVAPYPSYLI